jgi:hypothetical protein
MKTARIRIIKHEAVPGCGSFEVRFADGRASQYFYWDDIPRVGLDLRGWIARPHLRWQRRLQGA